MSTTEKRRSGAALDAKRGNMFFVDPDDVVIIGIDTKDGPEHPLYDERIKLPLVEEHVQNVATFGIQEPILLRKDGPTPQVIAGRQRVRWAREANRRRAKDGGEPILVPAIVQRASDEQAASVGVLENEIRVNDGFDVKAAKARRYVEVFHWSENDVARRFGVSPAAVRQWLSFGDLDESVRAAVASGEIAPTAAVQVLASQSREEQRATVAAARNGRPATKKQLSTRDLRGARSQQAGNDAAPSKRTLRRVLEHERAADLHPDVVKTLRWVLGEGAVERIGGLKAILNEISYGRHGQEE